MRGDTGHFFIVCVHQHAETVFPAGAGIAGCSPPSISLISCLWVPVRSVRMRLGFPCRCEVIPATFSSSVCISTLRQYSLLGAGIAGCSPPSISIISCLWVPVRSVWMRLGFPCRCEVIPATFSSSVCISTLRQYSLLGAGIAGCPPPSISLISCLWVPRAVSPDATWFPSPMRGDTGHFFIVCVHQHTETLFPVGSSNDRSRSPWRPWTDCVDLYRSASLGIQSEFVINPTGSIPSGLY
jgi:hypothetical protein